MRHLPADKSSEEQKHRKKAKFDRSLDFQGAIVSNKFSKKLLKLYDYRIRSDFCASMQ